MKDHVQRLATHLEIELEGEFGVYAAKAKMVYTVDNMNMLEDTFQKVHGLFIYWTDRVSELLLLSTPSKQRRYETTSPTRVTKC